MMFWSYLHLRAQGCLWFGVQNVAAIAKAVNAFVLHTVSINSSRLRSDVCANTEGTSGQLIGDFESG